MRDLLISTKMGRCEWLAINPRFRPFSALLYSPQVGQAFLPALERTGLEACRYFGGCATPTLKMA